MLRNPQATFAPFSSLHLDTAKPAYALIVFGGSRQRDGVAGCRVGGGQHWGGIGRTVDGGPSASAVQVHVPYTTVHVNIYDYKEIKAVERNKHMEFTSVEVPESRLTLSTSKSAVNILD
jgi:hypothetical protein